jgi:tRNA(fMet)-specific endonuclease VapC
VRYLVDSDWLIDAFTGIPTAVDLLAQLRDDGLAVSIISYGELFEGAIGAPDSAAELARFRRFLARLTLMALDDAIMERFARIRADLRRQGQLIPDLDLLIAATAIHHELILLTRNVRHFARIPELTLYQPS